MQQQRYSPGGAQFGIRHLAKYADGGRFEGRTLIVVGPFQRSNFFVRTGYRRRQVDGKPSNVRDRAAMRNLLNTQNARTKLTVSRRACARSCVLARRDLMGDEPRLSSGGGGGGAFRPEFPFLGHRSRPAAGQRTRESSRAAIDKPPIL